ncbi:PucR family transcriptional regulator [Jatrophihabitans sp. DSM 45814]
MVSGADALNRELSAVGAIAGARLAELRDEIWGLLTDAIPELRGDDVIERLLDASVEENISTLLHVFEHGIAITDVGPPVAATEYGRRLAQRGVPIIALIRAYRIGHGRFLSRCVEELAKRSIDVDLMTEVILRLVEVSFRYIDQITEQLVVTYQAERDRWLLARNAGRAARVRAVLAGEEIDPTDVESALGYRLLQHHLGAVVWVTGDAQGAESLVMLERLATTAARALGGDGRELFVPRDETVAWIWIPLGIGGVSRVDATSVAAFEGDASARIAFGEPGYGVEGFRQSHLQAVSTQTLALAARPGVRVTAFADVGTVALLCSDLPAARSWIWATLADLAIDDEPHERLRETLLLYLSTGSYRETAAQLTMHKNSVHYRLGKAREALGAPIDKHHADLELALRACHYLGQAVLRPVAR